MGYMTHYKLSYKVADPSTYKPCKDVTAGFPSGAKYCHICGRPLEPTELQLTEIVHENAAETQSDGVGGWSGSVLDALDYVASGESVSWYEHNEDMKKLSEACPGILFTLNGTGENAADVWVKYYLDGKAQESRVEVKLNDFDPTKLE